MADEPELIKRLRIIKDKIQSKIENAMGMGLENPTVEEDADTLKAKAKKRKSGLSTSAEAAEVPIGLGTKGHTGSF